jgi:hypothetical protein
MNPSKFEIELEIRLRKITNVLSTKSAEYSTKEDKHYNFKRAGEVLRKTPETALWGMFSKHFVSIQDIVEATEKGKVPNREVLEEKIGDAINYLILLETLIKERMDTHEI